MHKPQNIFDNPTFFEGYKELRARENNYNNLLEQPAMAALMPDVSGKTVLDLGCGAGHNCLNFVRRGAAEVVGVDLSEKMLAVAKEECSDEKITYLRMSMTEAGTLGRTFDLVYSSLAFHYVEDFPALAKTLYSLLNDGGTLLFSQEHPLTTATPDDGGHFNHDENGERISYTFSDYNRPGRREATWFVGGVEKYHRTFSDIVTALAEVGFVIERMEEPRPSEDALMRIPKMIGEFIKPSFLIVKAGKRA